MKQFIFIFCLLIPSMVLALEVDEKLTVRVVKASESKKTVMINRGTEDGLVEGDHAKFIVTAGIVARAVCVRVSPTRSVWSVYRLVNADFIIDDSVMSIKITPAVKITKDETQTIVQEDTPNAVGGDAVNLGIPLADGAQDLTLEEKLDHDEIRALEDNEIPLSIVEKTKEFYGFINISGLTANTKTDIGDQSFNNSQTFYHVGVGYEYYFQREREWFSRFSLVGEFALMRENSQGYNGAGITNELTEFGFGLNWHPFKLPSLANEFIPFLHFTFNVGAVKAAYESGSNGGVEDSSANGDTSGYSFGGGYKFYTARGYGVRMMFDYYLRSERYNEDSLNGGNVFNKKVGGPRLMVALAYRF